jgi:hypothetical protein
MSPARPNGRSVCEHRASHHDSDGVCEECASAPAAAFRPCAKPIPEEWRGIDPILQLRDREVRIVRRGHTKMICGKLTHADDTVVRLVPIERPMRSAQNGGDVKRAEIEDVALILDSWR